MYYGGFTYVAFLVEAGHLHLSRLDIKQLLEIRCSINPRAREILHPHPEKNYGVKNNQRRHSGPTQTNIVEVHLCGRRFRHEEDITLC